MTLCVFVLIASEFMPVSLLTPMAADMCVSEGWIGYGIAISGAFAVLTSLSIPTLAGSSNRKTLLLGLTALMGVSGLVVGMAPSYPVYLVGRALIGVVVGGFWAMSAAVAMLLVPAPSVAKALAIFNAGNALATVVAAPLGSYLGSVIGWRGAFFCLVPLAVLAFVWQWFALPSMRAMPSQAEPPADGVHLAQRFGLFGILRRSVVRWGMLAAGAFFMGQFMLFTYVRPFLEAATQVDAMHLSLVLLLMGGAGFVGTSLVGAVLKKGLYRTLCGITLLMLVIALALAGWGNSRNSASVLLALWGLLATAAPVGWWLWLAQTLPADAEAGGGMMVAVIQLSIALGSTAGGLLFDRQGYQGTFIASAGVLLLAAGLIACTATAKRAANG
ncbi:MFS transporter [Comamonas sp. JUb58]|uniref:MFS transporter n=1 Tax=Comamonas sp. JUb58 TaxID=2485114 RepID=UPI00105C7796|nr:MFS transporter [Comamonas sp. JUb58]